jgi:predicted DCC family thiol-disulfide oxidoreductase YuxK
VTEPSGSILPTEPTLLYDGACGFCARSVRFVLRHEKPGRATLNFATLNGPRGTAVSERFPAAAGGGSMVFYLPSTAQRPATVLMRSDAALALGRYLGGGWAVAGLLASLIPRALRDAVYDTVARHRHRLGGDACIVPNPEQRGRFELPHQPPTSLE